MIWKVLVKDPPAIGMDSGIVASVGSELTMVTVTPPAGAGTSRVTVAVVVVRPPDSEHGIVEIERDLGVGGVGGSGCRRLLGPEACVEGETAVRVAGDGFRIVIAVHILADVGQSHDSGRRQGVDEVGVSIVVTVDDDIEDADGRGRRAVRKVVGIAEIEGHRVGTVLKAIVPEDEGR